MHLAKEHFVQMKGKAKKQPVAKECVGGEKRECVDGWVCDWQNEGMGGWCGWMYECVDG